MGACAEQVATVVIVTKVSAIGENIKSNKPGHDKEHDKHVRFALKQAARMVHHSKVKYNIVKSMREEIFF